MVSIHGLSRAQVLAALYNHSHQQGTGFMISRGKDPITVEEAKELLADGDTYFDYLYGRVMKVSIPAELSTYGTLDERLYDRDNGKGAAELALLDAVTCPGSAK